MSLSTDLHSKHRKRFKQRYLHTKSQGFTNHELMELLLFYSIPRKNTNEVAHLLIEKFGSINGIAEASIEELKTVPGIGDNSAVLISLIMEFAKNYAETVKSEPKRLDSMTAIVEYAKNQTFGAVKELVYCVCMDDGFNVVGNNLIAVGNLNESRPAIRSVIELCVLRRATTVAIIHNHPNGGVDPSQADIDFTTMLERELDVIGVKLVEHIIVDSKGYTPILKELRDNGTVNVVTFKE